MTQRRGEPDETPGARIRRLRLDRQLSQVELAASGVSREHISRVERGERRATPDVIRKLAPYLGVSEQYLETGKLIAGVEERELRLADAELRLRLEDDGVEGEARFQELLRDALQAGDAEAALRARIGLGIAAARRGAFADVVRRLERVVADPRISLLTHPDVYASLGQALVERGRAEDAIALFRRCLDEADAAGRSPVYVRFAVYLSTALADAGDYTGAQEALDDAMRAADAEPAEPYTRVRLYWSQARLAAARGQSGAARSSIRRAIGLLEATEDTRYLAVAHGLAATIALGANRLDEAAEHFARVDDYAGALDTQDEAILRADQARLAARRGHAERAIALAREALELASGDPPERGRAEWALGEGLAAEGRIDEALAAYARAKPLLAGEGRFLPELLTAWARTLRAAGEPHLAADRERQAKVALRRRSRTLRPAR